MKINQDLISQNIIKYRTANKLTQKALANKVNIARTTLSEIECARKKPSLTLLLKIADALNVNLDNLLDGNLCRVNIIEEFDEQNLSHLRFFEQIKCSNFKQKAIMLEILRQLNSK